MNVTSRKRKIWKRRINTFIRKVNREWDEYETLCHWKFKLMDLWRDTSGRKWYAHIGIFRDNLFVEDKIQEITEFINEKSKNYMEYMANDKVLRDLLLNSGWLINR